MGISRWFAVIALQAVVTHSASASLLLQIERVSDNMAIVSSAGTLENPGTGTAGLYLPNLQNLLVENPFATALPNLADVRIFDAGSTMAFGPLRTPVSFADLVIADFGFFPPPPGHDGFYFGASPFTPGCPFVTLCDPITGLLQLVLPNGISFAPIGATGNVYWGNHNAGAAATGTWIVVVATDKWNNVASSVPEPATLSLIGLGITVSTGVRIPLGTPSNQKLTAMNRLHVYDSTRKQDGNAHRPEPS